MDITTDQPSADVAVIALAGELDGSNFERVIDAGRAARDGGAKRVVLDLSGLTYMGSSGLVAIHSIALLLRGLEPTSPEDGWQAFHDLGSDDTASDSGSGVVLAGPPPNVERVLDRSGMLSLFPVHPDRASAIAAATVASA
jgi:anti-anti-sigma regulatory factor